MRSVNLRRITVIATREFLAVVRSRAFVLSLVIIPLITVGSIFLQRATAKVKDLHDQRVAVIDRTPSRMLLPAMQADVERHNAKALAGGGGGQVEPLYRIEPVEPAAPGPAADAQRLALSNRVRSGSLGAILEIGSRVTEPRSSTSAAEPPSEDLVIRFQSNSPMFGQLEQLLSESINSAVRARRLQAAGLAPAVFEAVGAPVPVVFRGLARVGPDGRVTYGQASEAVASFAVPSLLAMMMFMVVVVGAVPLLQGVVEEKQNRIAEVLLGSVRPFDLMAGKVLGLVATSMTLIAFYMLGAYMGLSRAGFAHVVPLKILPWFFGFQLLTVLMFGSLYIAIGASVNDPKELQALMLPLNLVAVLPLVLLGSIIQHPNGPIAIAGTWFPFSSPIVTIMRMSISPGLPAWQALAAMGEVLVTTIVLVWAAGRVFRVGLIAQGKPPRVRDLLRWAIRG